MSLDFELTGGSVAGKDHRRGIPRNRQDAYHVARSRYGITAVVGDGCGSSAGSEVGATIGVQLMSTYLQRLLAHGHQPDKRLLARARQAMLAQLHVLAQDMGESLSEVVNSYLLFTLVGGIITPETATFFVLGDGVLVVNGELIVLDSGPNNQPAYLAYALTGSTLTDADPSLLDFQIVRQLPTAGLQHFLIGSDGVQEAIDREARCLPGSDEVFGPLSQFWEDDRYFVPGTVAVTRRLNLLARDWPRRTESGRSVTDGGLLSDDTTLIAGRRTPVI
ncbi:MAG TPA: protein phosphatase 2C domain-containing protein [Candidatus Saccharimonadales bacterium]|nr:protein phosphatase 2C domain-containing protein [Candidatus Saccharimonadales bacterium]